MPPISLTKGHRPPPFDGPPTAVSCGGEPWGDADHVARLIRRYSAVLERVLTLTNWSIEVVGLKSELERRYRALIDVVFRISNFDLAAIEIAHQAAHGRCERLEEEFFGDPNAESHAIIFSLQGGWLGPSETQTPKVISGVRSRMLNIYVDVRDRHWRASVQDSIYAREVVDRINLLMEELFSITGPDELDWCEWIESLADAGRVIKDSAWSSAGRGRIG